MSNPHTPEPLRPSGPANVAQDAQKAAGTHSNRACEACRSMKLRCLPGDPGQATCKRCAKNGRECVYLASKRRNPRTRTDTRVAQLEREVKNMRELLHRAGPAGGPSEPGGKNLNAGSASEQNTPGQDSSESGRIDAYLHASQPGTRATPSADFVTGAAFYDGFSEEEDNEDRLSAILLSSAREDPEHPYPTSLADVYDSGLVTVEYSNYLFDLFVNEVLLHSPLVSFSSEDTADEVRRTKPILFMACISAAASKVDAELHKALDQKISSAYGEQIMVRGRKSLELIQAILISAIWSFPPEKFMDTRFYMFVHMSAAMALNLNIDRDWDDLFNGPVAASPNTGANLEVTKEKLIYEKRRTHLGCWLACSSVAVGLRRPNYMRFTQKMKENLDWLETQATTPSEKTFVHWIRLQRIVEEVSSSFRLDEPELAASLSDTRTQMTVKAFERQFDDWKRSVPPNEMNSALYITYQSCQLCLHEIALHVDHKAESFQPPFFVENVSQKGSRAEPVSPAYVDAIVACIDASQRLLDNLLSMDIMVSRGIPVMYWARMGYALLVLVKLSLSTSAPASRLGQFVDASSLKVIEYMDRMLAHLLAISDNNRGSGASKFLATVFKLKKWYTRKDRPNNPDTIEFSSHDENSRTFQKFEHGARSGSGCQQQTGNQHLPAVGDWSAGQGIMSQQSQQQQGVFDFNTPPNPNAPPLPPNPPLVYEQRLSQPSIPAQQFGEPPIRELTAHMQSSNLHNQANPDNPNTNANVNNCPTNRPGAPETFQLPPDFDTRLYGMFSDADMDMDIDDSWINEMSVNSSGLPPGMPGIGMGLFDAGLPPGF